MMSSLTAPQVVLKAACPVVVMPSSVTAGQRLSAAAGAR